MRLSVRVVEHAPVSARERWRRDRAAAPALHAVFPAVASLSFDLKFEGTGKDAPAGQLHIFHPAAKAFFEFQCPYMNCNGKFDLRHIAQSLVENSSSRTAGAVECSGQRSRDGIDSPPCGVRLAYVIVAAYAPQD
jgi:hypothetical protein